VDRGTDVVYSESPDAGFVQQNKGRFDYAVVVVGEPPYAESFGDNLNLTIPAPGPSVIRDVCGSIRCAVVLVSGRPLVVEPYMGAVAAGHGGAGHQRRAVRRLRVHGEAGQDVVPVGGAAAHERRRRALRSPVPRFGLTTCTANSLIRRQPRVEFFGCPCGRTGYLSVHFAPR